MVVRNVPMYQARIPISGGGGMGGHIDLTRQESNPLIEALQQLIQQKRQREQDTLNKRLAETKMTQMQQPKQTKPVSGRVVVGGGKTWLVNPQTGEKRDLGIPAPTSKVGARNISDIINDMSEIGTLPEGTLGGEAETSILGSLLEELMKKRGLEEYEIPGEKRSRLGMDFLAKDIPARTEFRKRVESREVPSEAGSPITEAIETGEPEGRFRGAGIDLPIGSIIKGTPLVRGVNMPSGTILPKGAMALETMIPDENGRLTFITGKNVPAGTLLPPDPNPMLRSWYTSEAQRRQAESVIKEPRTPYQREEYNYHRQLGQAVDQVMASEERPQAQTVTTGRKPRPGVKIPGDAGGRPGVYIPGDKGYKPSGRPGAKIPGDKGYKSGRPGVTLPFDRPPKPKEYPDAKWSEEHQMWTIVKNRRLKGVK